MVQEIADSSAWALVVSIVALCQPNAKTKEDSKRRVCRYCPDILIDFVLA
jgi:hypothetical protein